MWNRVKDWAARAWVHGHSDDPITWEWHYWQAVGFYWIGTAFAGDNRGGVLLAGGIFGHREVSGFISSVHKIGVREAFRQKGLDGFMDFLAALLGIATGASWQFGGLWGLLAGVIFSHALIGIVALARRNRGR